ncbi:hypothetical protein BV898_10492 [Hypsibius exemplaris]|uniref:Secreted protein n=1 Tax=Hypsibius exemplaris TaxID=2072580 RepID=A0A1W0WJB5_HYPEX|nr:hypothetical protein BV898_10492 [Hypsibius exemplaris]
MTSSWLSIFACLVCFCILRGTEVAVAAPSPMMMPNQMRSGKSAASEYYQGMGGQIGAGANQYAAFVGAENDENEGGQPGGGQDEDDDEN